MTASREAAAALSPKEAAPKERFAPVGATWSCGIGAFEE